jgi:FtsH-binding integral membrane protein
VVNGALLLVLTAVASLVAALLLSRANPNQRLPLIGWPVRRPAVFWAALVVLMVLGFGATPSLGRRGWGDSIWLWSLGAMLVPLLVVYAVHNRRLKNSSAG